MNYDHEERISFVVGEYRYPVTLSYKGTRIFVSFRYNKYLIDEVKAMEGAKYHGFDNPPKKIWSVTASFRNFFALSFLRGENPYAPYQLDLEPMHAWIQSSVIRPLYAHQVAMIAHILCRHYCIVACEMGTGKTLAVIEAIERAGVVSKDVLYVGPKSGVYAVGREFNKWKFSGITPRMMTYEAVVKAVDGGSLLDDGKSMPRFLILDESSKIKNPNAKRSQAVMQLAEAVRDRYAAAGYVVLMSGTPAPKTPVDWWYPAEVACPGYIKEGNINKFKKRLCIVEERESVTGGIYPHVVAWLDDETKCAECGKMPDDDVHKQIQSLVSGTKTHAYKRSINEVAYLYKRLSGLVLVKFKKDCLDLPEKQYRVIDIKPTVEVLRHAQMIKRTSGRAIQVLTLLRELSDGFQYQQEVSGEVTCPMCNGTKVAAVPKAIEDLGATLEPLRFEGADEGVKDGGIYDANQDVGIHDAVGLDTPPAYAEAKLEAENQETEDRAHLVEGMSDHEVVSCPQCGGIGKVKEYTRTAIRTSSPKDEIFEELLDDHEDIGRLVVWGGFTETIDKLVDICHKKGWSTLKVDGRGYKTFDVLGSTVSPEVYLDAMDASHPNRALLMEVHPKVCFVGHPKAGGMALTLTASPTELFYSNTFDGEARMQAEDRFHRAGMDTNRGATIIDLIHLPTDKLILDNLKRKKDLQKMSMGDLDEALKGEIAANDDR